MADLIKKSVASPAGSDPLTYVMSDETVDRMGDVIEAKGWQLANFAKNPIALFGHDSSFVVGHWTDVRVQGRKLIGKLNLLPAGISERLDEIRAAVEAGVLRAVSVGFSASMRNAGCCDCCAGAVRQHQRRRDHRNAAGIADGECAGPHGQIPAGAGLDWWWQYLATQRLVRDSAS